MRHFTTTFALQTTESPFGQTELQAAQGIAREQRLIQRKWLKSLENQLKTLDLHSANYWRVLREYTQLKNDLQLETRAYRHLMRAGRADALNVLPAAQRTAV